MNIGHIKKIIYPLLLPHYIIFITSSKKTKILISSDIENMNNRCKIDGNLMYYLLYQKPYRNLFYYRIGRISKILSWYIKPYPLFFINTGIIGRSAFVLNHPYATIINAKSIGDNFTICHLTTIGNAKHGRNDLVPTIGCNVSLGANVTIIGDIIIGNNVIVGAGSVVINNVPDNCVVAGNPAKIIKQL